MTLAARVGLLLWPMLSGGAPDVTKPDLAPTAQLVRTSPDAPFLAFVEEGGSLSVREGDGYELATRLKFGEPHTLVAPSGGSLGKAIVERFVTAAGRDAVHVFWGQRNATRAARLVILTASSPSEAIGPGLPSAAVVDHKGRPAVAGLDGTDVWFARKHEGQWKRTVVASGAAYQPPALALSAGGTFRLVWWSSDGRLWHLECRDGETWLRSGGASRLPESIGTAAGPPTVACTRAQAVVAYANAAGQIEYSHFTGQDWNVDRPLTATDPRFAKDRCSAPGFAIAGDGVPWLFFVNETRRFVYFTRWLGFGFSPITVARCLWKKSPDFASYLLPIDGIAAERRAWPNSETLGLALVGNGLPERFRAETLATPRLVGRPDEEHLFIDDRELSRSLWVESHVPGPVKHEGNPVLTPGPAGGFDSHRVFNGGSVIREHSMFRMWYGALNPAGDWQHWTRLPRTGFARSDDGVHWAKPKIGLAEWEGSRDNNMVPGFGIVPFVMCNPDASDTKRRYFAYFAGSRHWSTDGLRWTRDEGCGLSWSGCKPQWFTVNSVIHDPDEPDPRLRWKAYGCFAPKDPHRAVGMSYSADGLTWHSHPENPVMSPISGADRMLHDVSVFRRGEHYLGICQKGNGYSIGLALIASRDGVNWWPVCEGTPFIPRGTGDAWDRGMLLPSQPVPVGNEEWLYYGGANYQAPSDQPFDYKRWQQCTMACGLAKLPHSRWVGLRTAGSVRHIGYVTTGPIHVENLKDCVLTVNVGGCDDKHYMLAEVMEGHSDARVTGYEHENCDDTNRDGLSQVISWKGCASLNGIGPRPVIRLRFIFRGADGRPMLYSWAFKRDPSAKRPVTATHGKDLVETALVCAPSVGDVAPQKSWIAYRPDGKPKPLVVLMHGYGDPVLRHGGQRMAGACRSYARRGLFAVAVDLRGREESAGLRDDGGMEILDVHDAVHTALDQYPREADRRNVNIIGWSGGGGNVFSAAVRFPDLWSNAAAFYGIADYGHFARTPTWRGVVAPWVGGTPDETPDRYLARNSTLAAQNVRHANFHYYWDEEETLCPAAMNVAFRERVEQPGYANVHAHESKATDAKRWLHTGITKPAAEEFDRTFVAAMLARNNPDPQLRPEGELIVSGYLMTKRFQMLFGHGNDAVVSVRYAVRRDEYRFTMTPVTSDPDVRGWLRIVDRRPAELAKVTENGRERESDVDSAGRVVLRDVLPTGRYVLTFR